MNEPCVAPRKDGRSYRGLGTIFDPARNELVYDAHRPDGPGSTRLKQGIRLSMLHSLAEAQDETQRGHEALALSLSHDGLNTVLKDLRNFRNGNPLQAKVRKLLEDILTEDN
jgi:hypothetical protein